MTVSPLGSVTVDHVKVGVVSVVAPLFTGDVKVGVEIYNRFMERMTNRLAYVGVLLKSGFDTSKKEVFL